MECCEKGYRGGENYLLLDFCYEDASLVYPIAERLVMEGVRIWFRSDRGQDHEEERIAAERLKNCGACVFVLSERSMNWPPLLAKTVFAFMKRKPVVFISLEKHLQKTVGLMMQAEYALNLDSADSEFYPKLLASPAVAACRESGVKPDEGRFRAWRERANAFRRQYEAEQEIEKSVIVPNIFSSVAAAVPVKSVEKPEVKEPEVKEPEVKQPEIKQPEIKQPKVETPESDGDETVYNPVTAKKICAAIVRLSNGEVHELKKSVVTLGRSSEDGVKPDIAFENVYGVSRVHAVLTEFNNHWSLRDDKSKFGTFVDGRELQKGETVMLSPLEIFRLRDEEFCIVQGQNAESLLTMDPCGVIRKIDELRASDVKEIPDLVAANEEEDVEKTIYEPKKPEFSQPKEEPAGLVYDDDPEEKTVSATASVDDLIADEMTVRISRKPVIPEDDPEATVRQVVLPAAVLRVNTGELFRLQQVETIIGRRAERRKADIMLDGNDDLSRHHAVIYQYLGRFMLRDCESAHGTSIGDERVGSDKATDLPDLTVFTMAGEDFVFLLGESLKFVQMYGELGILRSVDTDEKRAIASQDLRLDRHHPWKQDLLRNKDPDGKYVISRNHALLWWEKNTYMIRDLGSSNGTFVNHRQIETGGEGVKLSDGDKIGVYEVEFFFREVKLK